MNRPNCQGKATPICVMAPMSAKTDHEGADPRNRRQAVLSAGHSRCRRRHHRGRNRHQQAHAVQSLSVQGRIDLGLSRAAASCSRGHRTSHPSSRSSGRSTRSSADLPAKDFRGCPFVNAVAELGAEDQSVRKIAIAFKESRRLWFRDHADPARRRRSGSASRRSLRCWSTARSRRIWCATIPRWHARQRKPRRVLLANAGVKVDRSGAAKKPRRATKKRATEIAAAGNGGYRRMSRWIIRLFLTSC